MTATNLARGVAVALLLAASFPTFAAGANIHVTGAWARATPGGSANAAVYFTIINSGASPDRLLSVASPAAAKAELHESMSGGMSGMMEMKPSRAIDLAPAASVIFKPLGRHLMLMRLKRPLKEGDALSVTLRFEKAGVISVPVEVVAVSARGP